MHVMRFLLGGRVPTTTTAFRWIKRQNSSRLCTPLQGATASLCSSLGSAQPDRSSRIPESGKALQRNVSKVVISPTVTTKSRRLKANIHKDSDEISENNEKKLHLALKECIETGSIEMYENLLSSTTTLYKKFPGRYWRIHSRTLVNGGMQNLVDRKFSLSVRLLREAIEIVSFFAGDTAVLHLRVMLANALASDGECFAALCEYDKALAVMGDYPVESPTQIVSGKKSTTVLSRNYIMEDFDRFLSDEDLVMRALSQGHQQANSCKDSVEKIRITLSLARLQRRMGEKEACLPLYTSCLRTLLDTPDVDMEIRVVHDIGLLLSFEVFDVSQGLSYLCAAAEMSFDRVKEEREAVCRYRERVPTQIQKDEEKGEEKVDVPLPVDTLLTMRRAAFTLLDTAVCLAENEDVSKALALFEESISIMNDCGLAQHSVWARMKYADALATASLTDKSIHEYLAAMEMLRSSEQTLPQVACMGMVVHLSSAEVEGRLAHCFQVNVREYRRACVHFSHAIRMCGVDVRTPFPSKGDGEIDTATLKEEIDDETLCWMLENYASCCERIDHIDIAEEVLERRVSIEKDLGGSCAYPMLRLALLHTASNAPAKALKIYFELLRLPDDAIEPDTLMQAACNFASICYSSKDEDMESAICSALSMIKCNGKSDIDRINDVVVKAFKRAASIIMASHGVNRSRGKAQRQDELKALMTLSRGGFFCQRRGDEAGAEELYRLAVEYTQPATSNTNDDYTRELAIMLANYATVMVHKDIQKAEQLYDRAVTVCPTEESVSAAAASFFVLKAHYSKGRSCIERMIHAATDNTTLLKLYGKLAWLGVVCWDELSESARQECLQHLLLALGIGQEKLFIVTADPHSKTVKVDSNEEYKKQLLHGIAVSEDQDTVSLAGYVAQTKMGSDGKFVNDCYKIALTRFPTNTTLLVNYAKLCADYGSVHLARKYYATAFSFSHKDPRGSECYADYLAFLDGGGQAVAGEGLLRYQVERSLYNSSSSVKSQAYAHYAKYMAVCLPSPTIPAIAFENAIKHNPFDSRAAVLYSSFLWNVCGRALDARKETELKQNLAVKVENLYLSSIQRQPHCVALKTALGAFYVEAGDRFEDAVRVLETARKLSPQNVAVIRLLCATFHEEWMKELKNEVEGTNARLHTLLETTKHFYEMAVQMDPYDRLTLWRYCQFALHGLHDMKLVSRLMQQLHEISK